MNDRARFTGLEVTALVDGKAVRVSFDGACGIGNEERYRNCEVARSCGLPILKGTNERLIDDPCVIVGTGPSAIPLLHEIRDLHNRGVEIVAVKGAHDWLIMNGITPRAAVAIDPQVSRARCFKRLRDGVLYLCASQMHPATWAHLRGQRVLIWHSRIELDQEKRKGWADAYLVPGCSTTGNSALVLMYLFGRRNIHLYGFDSSIAPVEGDDEMRLLKLDGEQTTASLVVPVIVRGRTFESTQEMVAQAQEMALIFNRDMLPGVKVTAHGHGYYQALLKEGKARGWPV